MKRRLVLAAALSWACVACAATPAPALAPRTVVARADARLAVRVIAVQRLLYRDGADARSDRPAHVRAASALAWLGDRLAIAQDDAAFVALWDPATRQVEAVPLPAGRGGRRQFDEVRGNKADKLDLESAVMARGAHGDAVWMFGSGATPARDVIVEVLRPAWHQQATRVHLAKALFAALRARTDFAGSEMNIEGAVVLGETLRLFQRGNGAPRAGLVPVDATIDVRWTELLAGLDSPTTSPALGPVVRYDLGHVGGVRLTFTDAAPGPDGRVLYLASAEASPDAVRDGPVAGSVIGVLDSQGRARQALLADHAGKPLGWKLEGLALDRRRSDRIYLVADPDDPARPAVLITAELAGAWWN